MRLDIDSLAAVFTRYPVIAAYLFGSQATETTTPLSDVDIAVLLDREAPAPGHVQAALISDLMLVVGRSDVDVVILNTATPLLKERVISRGRLLYCRDEVARTRFEVAARREYLDTQRLRRVQDEALMARYSGTR